MTGSGTKTAELRAWAAGSNPLAAATELLIRAGFAQAHRPWIRNDEVSGRWWVDFESIREHIGGMSGGEQRLLRIAASIGADVPVELGSDIAGLDRAMLELVLTALSHANGAHVPGRTIAHVDGKPAFVSQPALLTWEHSPA